MSTETKTLSPFDDIRNLVKSVPPGDVSKHDAVMSCFAQFPGPQPVMGDWQEAIAWLAEWQKTDTPTVSKPLVAVFSGTHAVASQFPDSDDIVNMAKARVETLTKGAVAVRGVAASMGAAYKIYEMGLDQPVPDLTQQDTLNELDCARAIAFGMEVVAEGADVIALGNMGLGTATAAAAIARGLYGGTSEYWAGAHNDRAKTRISAVEKAAARSTHELTDSLHCLRAFGGRDLAGIVGAIIAARHQSIPVILDGFVVCAAAAVLHSINPDAISHCMAGHLSAEPAHGALLDRMNLTPLHNFGIAVGDGTGAAMALASLKAAVDGFETFCSEK